ncbi:hypothetical protein ACQH8C_26875, partial [Escherichia coli]|uniref:hypothetical protein n=1 Tax=Escherichia coli TaxID=562 RepID=UPI003CE9BDE2
SFSKITNIRFTIIAKNINRVKDPRNIIGMIDNEFIYFLHSKLISFYIVIPCIAISIVPVRYILLALNKFVF